MNPNSAVPTPLATRQADTDTRHPTASGPEAGWYPDPHVREQLRWWSGEVWTSAVRFPPVPGSLPAPPRTPAPGAPARATTPPLDGAPDDDVPDDDVPDDVPDDAPGHDAPEDDAPGHDAGDGYDWGRETTGRNGRPGGAMLPGATSAARIARWSTSSARRDPDTLAVWLIVYMPVVHLMAAAAALLAPAADDTRLVLLVSALYVCTLLLAIGDSAVLERRGFRSPPQSAWALLGPLPYLIARKLVVTRAVGRAAGDPLRTWIGALAGCALVTVVLALTVGAPHLRQLGLLVG